MTHPRVAIVLTQLGYGGAEAQTTLLLDRLVGTPWEPKVVISLSGSIEPYGRTIQSLGYPLEVLPRLWSFDLLRLMKLDRTLSKHRIDLVHAVHLLASAYCWTIKRPHQVVLPTVRGSFVEPGQIRRWIYRRMFKTCPMTLVNSERGASAMHEHFGLAPERTIVVRNGVDFADIRRRAQASVLRKAIGVGPEIPIIGFVGRNSRVKNVPRFIDVVRRVRARRPDAVVVLVGHGLGETARADLAPDLPASSVHFLGPRTDVPTVLADLDVLVLTSDSEGCPNVVLEALAVGTPVVAAAVGDVPRLLENWPERVITKDAVGKYVDALETILSDRLGARSGVRLQWPSIEEGADAQRMVDETVRLWTRLWEHHTHTNQLGLLSSIPAREDRN